MKERTKLALIYVNLTEQGFVKQHGVAVTEAELERAHVLTTDRLQGASCSIAS